MVSTPPTGKLSCCKNITFSGLPFRARPYLPREILDPPLESPSEFHKIIQNHFPPERIQMILFFSFKLPLLQPFLFQKNKTEIPNDNYKSQNPTFI